MSTFRKVIGIVILLSIGGTPVEVCAAGSDSSDSIPDQPLIPDVDFNSILESPDEVGDILTNVGFLTVSNVPGVSNAEKKEAAFRAIRKCVKESAVSQISEAKSGDANPDQVIRYSIATSTKMGRQGEWDFGRDISSLFASTNGGTDEKNLTVVTETKDHHPVDGHPADDCTMQSLTPLRSGIFLAAFRLIQVLEKYQASDSRQDSGLAQYLYKGEHLEHVHLYMMKDDGGSSNRVKDTSEIKTSKETTSMGARKSGTVVETVSSVDRTARVPVSGKEISSTVEAFPMHIDAGLLLGMSSWHDPDAMDVTFTVIDQNGMKVKLNLADLKNKVLFIGGSGWSRFQVGATGTTSKPLVRAVPHRVDFRYRIKKEIEEIINSPRAWYGLMVLPPPEHKIRNKITFHTFNKLVEHRKWAQVSSLACTQDNVDLDETYGESADKKSQKSIIVPRSTDDSTPIKEDPRFLSYEFIDASSKQQYQDVDASPTDTTTSSRDEGASPKGTTMGGLVKKTVRVGGEGISLAVSSKKNPNISSEEKVSEEYARDQRVWFVNQSKAVQEKYAMAHGFEVNEALEAADACQDRGGVWCWMQCQFNDEEKKAAYDKEKKTNKHLELESSLYEEVKFCRREDLRCYTPSGNPPKFPDGRLKNCDGTMDCSIMCDPLSDAGKNAEEVFCTGGTDMFMNGFQSVFSDSQGICLLFFHQSLKLNSWWKFVLAAFGVIGMGILSESIIKFRRDVHKKIEDMSKEDRGRGSLSNVGTGSATSLNQRMSQSISMKKVFRLQQLLRVCKVALYGLNMAVGYLVMLVAMMYSIELFVCTILGLAIGHFIFNSSTPPAESVTACCAGRNMGAGTTALERILGKDLPSSPTGADTNNIILHCGGKSCECIDDSIPPDTTVVTTANAFQGRLSMGERETQTGKGVSAAKVGDCCCGPSYASGDNSNKSINNSKRDIVVGVNVGYESKKVDADDTAGKESLVFTLSNPHTGSSRKGSFNQAPEAEALLGAPISPDSNSGGSSPLNATLTLKVVGMHCGACEKTISNGLIMNLGSIIQDIMKISASEGILIVRLVAAVCTSSDLKAKAKREIINQIEDCGFEVSPVDF